MGQLNETTGFMTMEQKAVASRKFLTTLCAVHPGKATQLLLAKGRLADEPEPELTPVVRFMRQDLELDVHERKEVNHSFPIAGICSAVAKHYHLSVNELLSNRRTADVVRPRHVAAYLSKVLTRKSLPEIGRAMGNRDHTTILHGVRKITKEREEDSQLNEDVQTLLTALADSFTPQEVAA